MSQSPICLWGDSNRDCNPAEITVRERLLERVQPVGASLAWCGYGGQE